MNFKMFALLTLSFQLVLNHAYASESKSCTIESEKYNGYYLFAFHNSLSPYNIILKQSDSDNSSVDGMKWIMTKQHNGINKNTFLIKSKKINEYVCASSLFKYDNRFKNHKTSQKRMIFTLPMDDAKKEFIKFAKNDYKKFNECKWRFSKDPLAFNGSFMISNVLYQESLYAEPSHLNGINREVFLKTSTRFKSDFKWIIKC